MSWPQAVLDGAVSLVFGVLLSGPLTRLWSLVAQLAWEGRVRRISGYWNSCYRYVNSRGELVQHHDVVRLDQWGTYISGKNEGWADHSYKIEGQFRQQEIVSGTWHSVRQEDTYHGTFQLHVSVDGQRMVGKWLGNSNRGEIRYGEWVWQKRR
jgi:hypothetical protein